mmetsp:Transcript_114600/g.323999  ORF Transcript_114600/g.323999 Transcript_114600/m.323999 type:complete len:210 (+) Transcript_114600:950-1579(+)
MNWKSPEREIVCTTARPRSSGEMMSRRAAPPKAATAMINTHCMSRRNPMKRFVMSHQKNAFALSSKRSIMRCCVTSSRPKARMHVSPRKDAVKQSKTGERLELSMRFNSVIDFSTNLRSRTMYISITTNKTIAGGTVMQTRTTAPAPINPRSKTSCNACESCSSTLPKSPLKRFKMRPCGFAEKKARCVPSTCCSAWWCKDEEARKEAP